MKRSIALATVLVAASCVSPDLAKAQTICTAVQDAVSGRLILAQGDCGRRVTPASTFKIAISLMGYDAGVLKDAHHPALPYKDGYAAWRPEWKQAADPTRWMARSVVWYSQQTTTSLGEARFARYVREFQYGDQDVSGGLTRAWLSSSLQISSLEQLGFLSRMLQGRLPVSEHAVEMTAQLAQLPEAFEGWTIHGKTGSGAPRTADGGYDSAREFGWFVGWATKGARRVVFARLVQAEGSTDEPIGLRAKRELLVALPALLREESR